MEDKDRGKSTLTEHLSERLGGSAQSTGRDSPGGFVNGTAIAQKK
jgi:hypothetical protein